MDVFQKPAFWGIIEVTDLMKNKIDEKTLNKTVNTIGAYTVMKYREV